MQMSAPALAGLTLPDLTAGRVRRDTPAAPCQGRQDTGREERICHPTDTPDTLKCQQGPRKMAPGINVETEIHRLGCKGKHWKGQECQDRVCRCKGSIHRLHRHGAAAEKPPCMAPISPQNRSIPCAGWGRFPGENSV